MDLDTLKHLIQTTSWFSNLGHAHPLEVSGIGISVEQWKQIFTFSTEAEFGLPYDATVLETIPFIDFDWLPTTVYQSDPIHKENLAEQARKEGKENAFKSARLEIFRLTQRALRGASEHPLFIVGSASSNLTGAARGAALFACRAAAAELVLGQPNFWCDIVLLYHAGNWPFGTTKSGDTLVL